MLEHINADEQYYSALSLFWYRQNKLLISKQFCKLVNNICTIFSTVYFHTVLSMFRFLFYRLHSKVGDADQKIHPCYRNVSHWSVKHKSFNQSCLF